MNIDYVKKERNWPNTGEMMTFIQQQMILLTVDTIQSYIQMATIHTCTSKCNSGKNSSKSTFIHTSKYSRNNLCIIKQILN